MRLLGLLAVSAALFGQTGSLRWVELADTVYIIDADGDTVLVGFQSRAGNVRRFEARALIGSGGPTVLISYDSVLLNSDGRVDSIIFYSSPEPGQPPAKRAKARFNYPASSRMEIKVHDPTNNLLSEIYAYGLGRLEGSYPLLYMAASVDLSALFVFLIGYPHAYLTEQWGDSLYQRDYGEDGDGSAYARRSFPGACDTIYDYTGIPPNQSLNFKSKLCHRSGRIDSIIAAAPEDFKEYWSYDDQGLPVRRVLSGGNSMDTTYYIYEQGRLVESRYIQSGRLLPRYVLRYSTPAGSLSGNLDPQPCLEWHSASRTGRLTCLLPDRTASVRLYDIQGRVLWEVSVRGAEVFTLSAGLPPGLYYLQTPWQSMPVYLMP